MTEQGTSFWAPCPCGNPDVLWRIAMQDADGGSWDFVADQVPGYVVECPVCGASSPLQLPPEGA